MRGLCEQPPMLHPAFRPDSSVIKDVKSTDTGNRCRPTVYINLTSTLHHAPKDGAKSRIPTLNPIIGEL